MAWDEQPTVQRHRTATPPKTVTRHDWNVDNPTHAVVQTLADATDADPIDLPPLTDAVDPDALDALLDSDTDTTISFTYADHTVTLTDTGRVVAEPND